MKIEFTDNILPFRVWNGNQIIAEMETREMCQIFITAWWTLNHGTVSQICKNTIQDTIQEEG